MKKSTQKIKNSRSQTLNQQDFAALLVEHGFSLQTYDFDATMLGFEHDIFNALIHNDPVFSPQSAIRQQPRCPSALIRCELITECGDLPAAIQHFYARWFSELRYENPTLELLNLEVRADAATIHALTISKCNAMTFLFNIKGGAQ